MTQKELADFTLSITRTDDNEVDYKKSPNGCLNTYLICKLINCVKNGPKSFFEALK